MFHIPVGMYIGGCEWIVYQLPIMIIYNSTWSILIQFIRVMIVRWRSNVVNTKESELPVCDKKIRTNKRKVQKGRRLKRCKTVHCFIFLESFQNKLNVIYILKYRIYLVSIVSI